MVKLDPIIAVKDVLSSSRWYEELFGLKSKHGGSNFAVLQDESGETVICLHEWGSHNHPSMTDPTILPGNGLILYFKTTDFESIRGKAEEMEVQIIQDTHLNTNSNRLEFSIKDLDGYYISITEYHNYQG
ncbi:VOC family protein [Sphingobacterium daejeonense]|uniref:VOC family protein n=1 Tax=Sphingobacterium daejeonense TaxID=371142 RepID=UPI0010C38336|nr:VOC family protein [Sphingobacterium daejeonense]VTP97893.1 Glyoxalase-like domain [Sphingobacterium daejeonense]